MVTQITLGNAFTQNGRTIVGGSQSGFDIKSLVDSLATAKAKPATDLTDQNKKLTSQQTAFTSLKTILGSLQTASDALRNPPGVGNASSNVFAYRTASSTTNTGVAASSYATVTVQPGANVQTITIDSIDHLARQTIQKSGTFTLADSTTVSAVSATATAGMFTAGTFTLKALDGGANQSITLNAGDTLQSVVNKFNDVSAHTGIQVNIINVGGGTYQLIYSGTKTGAANDFNLTSASTVISDTSGALSSIGLAAPMQTARDAQFSVNGVTITRDSNSVADVISGVTFNLSQATPALTTITTTITPDTSIALNAIQQFATAYNDFRYFQSKQNQRNSDGSPTADAVLAQDTTLRSIISQITSEVTRTVSGITGSTDPKALADLGVTFADSTGDATNPATDSLMSVDTTKLTSALTSNFTGVRKVFEYTLTADNSKLSTYVRTNALGTSAFTLNINRTAGTYTASYVDSNGATQSINLDATPITATGGLQLNGQSGTVLEGLKLLYAGTDTNPSPINVTITQGIGDRLFNAIESFTNATNGSLTNAVKALSDKETANNTAIDKINAGVATYRDQITTTYSQLESALSAANNLLELLDAQQKARSQNN